MVADTGQVLSSVVWGENANESKVIKQLFFYQQHLGSFILELVIILLEQGDRG